MVKKLAEEVFSIVGHDPLIEVGSTWLLPYICIIKHQEMEVLKNISLYLKLGCSGFGDGGTLR